MLHYEQVFGNVFKKRGSKCRPVLMKHCCKVKGEPMIILEMIQQLKTKNINDVTGKLFCRQCKAKFFVRDRVTVLMMKINFNLLQIMAMNSLNVKHQGESSNWHFTCQLTVFTKTFKSNISEA